MIQKRMLNAWQILGIVLLLIGLAYVIYRETGVRPATPIDPVAPPPTMTPADTTVPPTNTPAKTTPIPTH